MLRQDFFALRAILAKTMHMNMARAIENGDSKFDYCYMEDNKVIDVFYATGNDNQKIDDTEAFKGKMDFVNTALQAGREVEISGISHTPYCTTYAIGTRYTIKGRQLRESIADYQIKVRMKNFITKKIREGTGNEFKQLDCKVMDLFKEGIITWNDVLVSHGKECSI